MSSDSWRRDRRRTAGLKKYRSVAAALAVVCAAIAPAVASAYVAPRAVRTVWRATGTQVRSLECVSNQRLARLKGEPGAKLSGLSERGTRRVWLSDRYCRSISNRIASGRDDGGWYVAAVTTIGHEAAHLRGVRNERKAECAGVRFAYAYLRRTGQLARYGDREVREYLLDDSGRSPAYKLDGTCKLP